MNHDNYDMQMLKAVQNISKNLEKIAKNTRLLNVIASVVDVEVLGEAMSSDEVFEDGSV